MSKTKWTTTILKVRLIVFVMVFALCSLSSIEASATKNEPTEGDVTEWKKDVPSATVLFGAFLSYNDEKMEDLSKQLVRLGYLRDGMEFTKPGVCTIYFLPGSSQNAIDIEIVDEDTKVWFWSNAEVYLSEKKGCGIDYWSSPTISLWRDF